MTTSQDADAPGGVSPSPFAAGSDQKCTICVVEFAVKLVRSVPPEYVTPAPDTSMATPEVV